MEVEEFDSKYLRGKSVFCDYGFQNMFLYNQHLI